MPVYTPALKMAPIASHPVRMNASNARIIIQSEVVFIPIFNCS